MGEAAKKQEDEEKLIPVGPGAEGLPEATPNHPEEPEDERLAQKTDDEEGVDEEKPAQRRKESAKERRERAKKAHTRDRIERDFLLKRNEELEKRLMVVEGRTAQNEFAAIDQRINTIRTQISTADRVLTEALRKPNGAGAEEFVEAQRIRDELRDQLGRLESSKTAHRASVEAEQHARREAPPPKADQRVVRHAREWAERHDWFDFDGTDEDSVIVRALDQALAEEGLDPSTEEYWEELTARVKRRLPDRFRRAVKPRDDGDIVDDEEETTRTPSGPKFSSGGRERPLRKNEVYVSPERKKAMQEYGVWDDPVARARMLKRYAQWDADAAATKS